METNHSNSVFDEVRADFHEGENCWHINAWYTHEMGENRNLVAIIDNSTGNCIFLMPQMKNEPSVVKTISEVCEPIKRKINEKNNLIVTFSYLMGEHVASCMNAEDITEEDIEDIDDSSDDSETLYTLFSEWADEFMAQDDDDTDFKDLIEFFNSKTEPTELN